MHGVGRKYWVQSGIFMGNCFIWKQDWGHRAKVIYCTLYSRSGNIGIYHFINEPLKSRENRSLGENWLDNVSSIIFQWSLTKYSRTERDSLPLAVDFVSKSNSFESVLLNATGLGCWDLEWMRESISSNQQTAESDLDSLGLD